MPHTYVRTLYEFGELDDSAKERARDWWRSRPFEPFEVEHVVDDFKECLALIGIEVTDGPYWSVSFSQGDGATFGASYEYRKGAAKAVRQHAPMWTQLHAVADQLQRAQRRIFYQGSASWNADGRHYGPTNVLAGFGDWDPSDFLDTLDDVARELCHMLYVSLRDEIEHQMSDEIVDENIRINEYTFDENGNREG